jgi:hypothetical protein
MNYKLLVGASLACCSLFFSCKKSKSNLPKDVNFRGILGNERLDFGEISLTKAYIVPKTLYGEILGTQELDQIPCFRLSLAWHGRDSITATDIEGLPGKTLYFDDPQIQPSVELLPRLNEVWTSIDTGDHNFFITISTVSKAPEEMDMLPSTYSIHGSLHAIMINNNERRELRDGTFAMYVAPF